MLEYLLFGDHMKSVVNEISFFVQRCDNGQENYQNLHHQDQEWVSLSPKSSSLITENSSYDSSGVVKTAGLGSFSYRSVIKLIIHHLIDILKGLNFFVGLCKAFGDVCMLQFFMSTFFFILALLGFLIASKNDLIGSTGFVFRVCLCFLFGSNIL